MTITLHMIKGARASLEERTLQAILEGDYAESERLTRGLTARGQLKIVADQTPAVPLHEPDAPHQSD